MQSSNSALSAGTLLDSGVTTYKIISTLGQGGFGITYLVTGELKVGNVTTEAKFAIKEHFPEMFATRNGDEIVPNPDKQAEYENSLTDFKAEAKKLAKMGDSNPNIVKVNEVFEANGTAYYVMEYINGESLTKFVESRKKLSFQDAVKILTPIFDAVDSLHKSNINHLDIKPDNIMLHEGMNGLKPILIDFGLSIHFKKSGAKTSPKGVQGVSEGYSPMEQYVGIHEFRPETDIYALAATLLFAITGVQPKSAAELKVSDLRPVLLKLMPENAVEGMCKALAKSSDDRTSSVSVFKSDLGLTGSGNKTTVINVQQNGGGNKLSTWLFAALGGIVLIVGCVLYFNNKSGKAKNVTPTENVTDPTSDDAQKEVEGVVSEATGEETVKPEENTSKEESAPETVKEKPQPTQEKETKKEKSQKQAGEPSEESRPTKGSVSLGYGTWTGEIRNGKPDGKGTVRFSRSYQYPGTSDVAEAGYYLTGTYENGRLVIGKLYDSEGNFVNTLMP